jgi:hypothetical protein
VTVAVVRPDSWNLPLFVHVLGAMALFGATFATATLAWVTPRRPDELARATFRTLVAAVIPAWVVMRIGAQLIESKEDFAKDPGWVDVGFVVSEPGLIVILAATGIAFWASRRRGEGWQPRAVAILATLYIAALAVAWWAMSAKPGSASATRSTASITRVASG